MKVKNLPDDINLRDVRVKISSPFNHDLPRRAYYWIYSITGFTTWIKTSKKSGRVYPIQMMSNTVLNLEVYKEKKRKKK